MKLREEILKEHSKSQCTRIVEWVGDSQERFDELFGLFLNDEYRVVQRAAWPVSYCVIANPAFIKKHFGILLKNLRKSGLHDSVKRNTIRLLEGIDIPAKYHGDVMDLCFNYIASPREPVAVKSYSLAVLKKLSQTYPEIVPEIKLVIEERWDHETAAFKSRARKIFEDVK